MLKFSIFGIFFFDLRVYINCCGPSLASTNATIDFILPFMNTSHWDFCPPANTTLLLNLMWLCSLHWLMQANSCLDVNEHSCASVLTDAMRHKFLSLRKETAIFSFHIFFQEAANDVTFFIFISFGSNWFQNLYNITVVSTNRQCLC